MKGKDRVQNATQTLYERAAIVSEVPPLRRGILTRYNVQSDGTLVLRRVFQTQESELHSPADKCCIDENSFLPFPIITHRPKTE